MIRRLMGYVAVGLALPLQAAQGAATLPDWKSLQGAVAQLEIYRAGAAAPETGVGFFAEGVNGLVTSHRLVKGASRVVARTAGSSPVEITRYLARDAKQDIVLLDAPAPRAKLTRTTHHIVFPGQYAFALSPASDAPPAVPLLLAGFQGAGVGELLAVSQSATLGTPVADSLGRVLGMIQPLNAGDSWVYCALPIRRMVEVASRPDAGGPLSALAADPAAPWTDPGTAEGMQVMGAASCRGRRFDAGIALLTRATQQSPKLVEAWMEWGMALQMQDRNPEAEAKYREALRLAPGNARAHLYLGSCLFNQEMLLKAQEEYDAALKADPQFAQVYVNLAGVYFKQGKKEDAEAAFRRALELEPTLGNARYNLGVLFASEGRMASALSEFEALRKERSGFATQLKRFMGSGK
jgi:Flp pilus assembly protein TadD